MYGGSCRDTQINRARQTSMNTSTQQSPQVQYYQSQADQNIHV